MKSSIENLWEEKLRDVDRRLNALSSTGGVQAVLDEPTPSSEGKWQVRLIWHPRADYPARPDEIYAQGDSAQEAVSAAWKRVFRRI